NVAHLDRHPCGGFLYDDAGDFARIMHLAIEKLKHELVVTLNQAWRLDKIGPLDGAKNVLHGYPRPKELAGIRDDVVFGNVVALNEHGRDAVYPINPRLDFVRGDLPQPRIGNCVGGDAEG